MIITPLLNFILPYLSSLLDLIPTIDINIYGGYLDKFVEYLSLVTYLLPLDKLMPILTIIILLTVFRLIIAIARVFIDIIPIF